jgi:hypothetical protein
VLWPTDKSLSVLRAARGGCRRQIDEGRTIGSPRDAILPGVIAERLREWCETAATHELPTGPQDFNIPGRAAAGQEGPRRAHDPTPGEALGRQVPAAGVQSGRGGRRCARLLGRRHPVRRTARAHQLSLGGGRERPGGGRELSRVAQDDHCPYQEDLGYEFELPYPLFAEQLRRARERYAPPENGRHLKSV